VVLKITGSTIYTLTAIDTLDTRVEHKLLSYQLTKYLTVASLIGDKNWLAVRWIWGRLDHV